MQRACLAGLRISARIALILLFASAACSSDGTGPGDDSDGDDPGDVPGAPSGLVANPGDAGTIILTWTDNSSAESGFEVQRSLQSGSGFTDIATTAADATGYLDSSIQHGTTYFYRVRLVGPDGASAYSNVASTESLPAPDPSAPFDCERDGYPCTWSDVGRGTLDESDRIADDVLEMLDEGASVADAVAFLDAMPGVAEIESSDVAIRFRLRGGRPTWVLGPDARLLEGPPGGGHPQHPPVAVSPSRALSARDVVGDVPKSKSALILSPFQYQFKQSDEGAELAALLGADRSYEGNVQYVANTDQSQEVAPSDFMGWDGFDVVHVSTHGAQVCGDDGCKTVIVAGNLASAEVIVGSADLGVDLVKIEYGEQAYGASTDFFRSKYPSGLPDTIVFMSACQTAKGNDLAQVLAGQGGAYLGWTESVHSGTAHRAALAFFTNLIEKGIPATKAFEALKEGVDLTTDQPGETGAVAKLEIFSGGDDLRIREVVFLQNPLTKEELPANFPYPVVGQPGDGAVDRIPFLIKVDGVEGNPAGFTVHVEVNGISGPPVSLATGEAVDADGNAWQVKGEVPVTFDAQQGQSIEIRARVDLPEGGTSEWDESAQLGNPALRFISMIETAGGMDPIVKVTSEVKAEFDLALDNNLEKLTGGDVLGYERFNVEVGGQCTSSATTVDGRLEVVDGDFVVNQGEPAVPGRLILFIPPIIRENLLLVCNGFPVNLPFIHYFAGFYSFHGGEVCGGGNEVDEALGGLVITGWQAGAAGVLARKEYDRSCTVDNVTFTERTTIDLVDPRGG